MAKQEPNDTVLSRERPTRAHCFHGSFPWDGVDAYNGRGESQMLDVDSKAKRSGRLRSCGSEAGQKKLATCTEDVGQFPSFHFST